MRAVVSFLALLASTTAVAAPSCPSSYPVVEFRGAISQAEQALEDVNMSGSATLLNEAAKKMLCMDEPALPTDIARFARTLSLLGFYGQDEFAAIKYGHMAMIADMDSRWPPGVSDEHPYRMLIEEEEPPITGGPEDPTLAIPRGGAFYMNGVSVTEARAPAEVPQFVQIFDTHGERVDAYWQDGAAFRPEYLGSGTKGGGGGINIPLAAGGAGALIIGAILYGAAAATKGTLKDAKTADELTATRTTANLLVMTSGVLGAAGLGVGAAAVLTPDHAGLEFNIRF